MTDTKTPSQSATTSPNSDKSLLHEIRTHPQKIMDLTGWTLEDLRKIDADDRAKGLVQASNESKQVKPAEDLPSIFTGALDFEFTGTAYQYPICAGGQSVLRDGHLIDTVCIPAYREDLEMEPRCKEEFWDKFPDILKQLTVTDTAKDHDEILVEMIAILYQGMYDSQKLAREIGAGDVNNWMDTVVDICRFNFLVTKFHDRILAKLMSNIRDSMKTRDQKYLLPLPSSLYDGQFGHIWDVATAVKYLCIGAGLGDETTSTSQRWKLIRAHWVVPDQHEKNIRHDHLPHHDAYVLAHQGWILELIARKRLPLRESQVSTPSSPSSATTPVAPIATADSSPGPSAKRAKVSTD